MTIMKNTFWDQGKPLEFQRQILIPNNATTTFMASNNSVTWNLEIQVILQSWASWQYDQAVTVRP